jgi:hypothetical protein
MNEELATVLRLVSEGRLTPEEAAPIVEALSRTEAPWAREARSASAPLGDQMNRSTTRGRRMRIRVSEGGRSVVDVRVPLAFAAMAASMVPGIPESYAELIRQAVETDEVGPIVDTEDDQGDAVLISIE